MAKELNPPELLAKRGEESRKRMEKNLPDESPVDPARVEAIQQFNKSPQKFFEKMFIDQQCHPRDQQFWLLLLLARIESKLH